MASAYQLRKTEEKLGVIFGRIAQVRRRLNSLAWQRGVFGTLAWMIAMGAIIVLAAHYLQPLTFLVVLLILGVIAILGVSDSVRVAWRMHVNRAGAASIADRRAELKGRLETIIEIGQRQKVVKLRHGPEHLLLWSYLIEDTLSRKDEFDPERIEARRVSRSIYGLLGAIALALAIFPLITRMHGKPLPVTANDDEVTLDLNDLHLRAADPDSDDGVEVHADAATMRRLQDKLAAEGPAGSGKSSDTPMDKMMSHAKGLAGRLQDKLTGRTQQRQRLTLKLADNSQDLNSLEKRDPIKLNPHRHGEDADAHFEHEKTGNDSPMPNMPPPNQNTPKQDSPGGGGDQDISTPEQRANQTDSSSDKSDDQANNDSSSNGGSSHGIGADPDTLF
ncbi:MAG TPA: hypothetical protein VKR29_03115, partial [Candidatus Binataceae bacterium]|nr:hypothetical protein [Candidatus Binataceae bacterium]